MLKYLLILSSIFLFSFSFQSKQNPDFFLEEFYGKERLISLKSNSPATYNFQKYYVANGVDIMENVPDYKLEGLEDISDIPLFRNKTPYTSLEDLEQFNVLFVNLPKRKYGAYIYRIGKTNSVLIIHDQNTLITNFNNLPQQ